MENIDSSRCFDDFEVEDRERSINFAGATMATTNPFLHGKWMKTNKRTRGVMKKVFQH